MSQIKINYNLDFEKIVPLHIPQHVPLFFLKQNEQKFKSFEISDSIHL